MSKSIILTSQGQANSSDYTVTFPQAVELNNLQYECTLSRIDTYFSYYNVTSARQNNIFGYNNGVDDVGLIIPDGLYSLENLIKAIHTGMKTEGDFNIVDGVDVFDINFYPNIATGHVDMVLTNGFTVDFTDNNIRLLLGFNSQQYIASATSESKADINYGVTKIMVHCSLVNGSTFINGLPSDVLYSFTPSQQENEEISIEPNEKYLKVYERNAINSVRMWLSDQLGRPIYFNNVPISYELHLKPLIMSYK